MVVTEDNLTEETPAKTPKAMVSFDPSQRRFFDDDSRVIAVNWHRQKGKDFVAAAKAVASSARKKQNWYITSLTQRQADASFDKADKFVEAYKTVLKMKGKVTLSESQYEEYDSEIDHTFVRTARTITLPNGAKIVALPGKNPDTLAGLTGNIILTEFGLFPKGGYEHWRVIFPLTTRGFQACLVSTPRGKKSKYYEICSDPSIYSVHLCPISKSVAEDGYQLTDNKGQPCTLEAFKRLYNDDAGWQREYECQFTGDLDALISWANLLSARDPLAQFNLVEVNDGHGWDESLLAWLRSLPAGRLEMGWDVARTGHLSPLWVNLAGRDGKKNLVAMVLMHNTPFALQRQIIQAVMDCRPGSVGAGDATGLGNDSNETLKARYRDNWTPVMFNGKSKSELGSLGRTAYGDGLQRLPDFTVNTSTKFIATDLYSIQCTPTGDAADKRLALSETENELEPRSHCDIAYSGLLALLAGTQVGGRLGTLPRPLMDKPEDW